MAVLIANTTRAHTHGSTVLPTIFNNKYCTKSYTSHESRDGPPEHQVGRRTQASKKPEGARAALPSAIPPAYSGPRARSEARVRESEVLTAGTGRRKRGKGRKTISLRPDEKGESEFAFRSLMLHYVDQVLHWKTRLEMHKQQRRKARAESPELYGEILRANTTSSEQLEMSRISFKNTNSC